jgi:hypothetical protein
LRCSWDLPIDDGLVRWRRERLRGLSDRRLRSRAGESWLLARSRKPGSVSSSGRRLPGTRGLAKPTCARQGSPRSSLRDRVPVAIRTGRSRRGYFAPTLGRTQASNGHFVCGRACRRRVPDLRATSSPDLWRGRSGQPRDPQCALWSVSNRTIVRGNRVKRGVLELL